jgi:hypothetical protein
VRATDTMDAIAPRCKACRQPDIREAASKPTTQINFNQSGSACQTAYAGVKQREGRTCFAKSPKRRNVGRVAARTRFYPRMGKRLTDKESPESL